MADNVTIEAVSTTMVDEVAFETISSSMVRNVKLEIFISTVEQPRLPDGPHPTA